MRLPNDDETRRVSNVYLGPPEFPTFWEARYSAYLIGLVLMLVAVIVERQLGIRGSLWSWVYTLIGVVLATRFIGKFVTYDIPVRALVQIFWCELTAPRPPRRAQEWTARPARVRTVWQSRRRASAYWTEQRSTGDES